MFVLLVFFCGCENRKTQLALLYGGPLAKVTPDKSFHFVVIGDTRTGINIFSSQRDEINCLDPDFVIDVGDLIDGGYVDDKARTEEMWNEFDTIVEQFTVPFVMVPGNHDIWDTSSREIYERRYGKTYFSFDHKGAHFIALDSEISVDRIDEKQINWLKRDLAANRNASAIFVFLHKPFWQTDHVPDGANIYWMRDVHPLLVEYGVSAVFAGHKHAYIKFPPIDGVGYYISGGGGAGVGPREDRGDFHHYCLVTLRDKQYTVAVIRPGSVRPDTIVSPSIDALVRSDISAIDVTPKDHSPLKMEFHNLSNAPVDLLIKPTEDTSVYYKIEPKHQKRTLNIGTSEKVSFNIHLDDIQYVYPSPRFEVQMKAAGKITNDIIIPAVKSIKAASCRKRTAPVKIDGVLDDTVWAGAEPLSDFWKPDAGKKARFQTQVRLAYDDDNIYLAFRCYESNLSGMQLNAKVLDGSAWADDAVEIYFDTNLDRKTYYQLAFNANAVAYDALMFDSSWNGEYLAKAARESDAWTLEVAVPWKTIQMTPPKPGTVMGFAVVRNRTQQPSKLSHWSPTYSHNHVPGQFGTLTFK